MKRELLAVCLASATLVAAAAPRVSTDSIRLDCVGSAYRISYRLENGPAVITMSLFTNEVQLLNVSGLEGDVFKCVETGDHVVTWKARKFLPGLSIKDKSFKIRVTAWSPDNLPDYQVTGLVDPFETRWYASLDELPDGGLSNRIYRTERIVMRKIPARGVAFRVGCGSEYSFSVSRMTPDGSRLLTLSEDYYIGLYEFTQGQYVNGVGRDNPSYFRADNASWTSWVTEEEHGRCDERPLENRAYNSFHGSSDAVGTTSDLGILRDRTKIDFDVPTEAQWEFAARAGVTTPWIDGKIMTAGSGLKDYGGFGYLQPYDYGKDSSGNARNHWPFTLPVGRFRANKWGLYDIHANVSEACRDKMNDKAGWMDKVVYPVCAGVDPQGVPEMQNWDRVGRGGSYEHGAGGDSYLGRRYSYFPHEGSKASGYRLVCPAHIASQDGTGSRKVLVSYTVPEGEDVFVTGDVEVNGASVQTVATKSFAGDIGKKVAPGDHKFYWFPEDSYENAGAVSVKVKMWPQSNLPPCLVTDLTLGIANHFYYSSFDALPGGLADNRYRSTHLVLSHIPAANVIWRMGYDTTVGATSARRTESAHHYVKLTSDYYMGIYPVTQSQYENVVGSNPSVWADDASAPFRPVNNVSSQTLRGTAKSWPQDGHEVDPSSVLAKFRSRTGLQFDLPTEAQWEFAARGGDNANGYCNGLTYSGRSGQDATGHYLSDYAYFAVIWTSTDPRYISRTREVGKGLPTGWGLYDMQGNAWDLCLDWMNVAEDWYKSDYSATYVDDATPIVDPLGCASADAKNEGKRAMRGGSIYQGSDNIDIPFRYSDSNESEGTSGVTFRLVTPVL